MKVKARKMFAFIMVFVLICSCNFTEMQAKKIYRIKKLFLNAKQKKLFVGSTYRLKVKRVKPVRATKKVKWKSANKAVATVNKKGLVKAKKVGTAQITAISKGSKKVKAKCKIVVVAKPDSDSSGGNNNSKVSKTPVPATTQPGGANKTPVPVVTPTEEPGTKPTGEPVVTPTGEPVVTPTGEPVVTPTGEPVATPTGEPVVTPTGEPVVTPTGEPVVEPTEQPTQKPDIFTVVFVDYDGSVIETKEAVKNESVTPPKEPMRKGYKFTGWDKEFDHIISDLVVTAQYEEDHTPSIFVRKTTALPGENIVEVEVCVRNNPGILGMTLSVSFDETALTLIEAENGEAIHDVLTLTKSKVLKSGCKFVWDGQELTENDIKDGTVLVLVFNVSETAQSGEYQIAVNCNDGDIIDNELMPISLSFENGYIKLSD